MARRKARRKKGRKHSVKKLPDSTDTRRLVCERHPNIGSYEVQEGVRKVCHLVKEAIKDETKAPDEYRKILRYLPRNFQYKESKANVQKIIKDEQKHLAMVKDFYREYCAERGD